MGHLHSYVGLLAGRHSFGLLGVPLFLMMNSDAEMVCYWDGKPSSQIIGGFMFFCVGGGDPR